MRGLGSRYPNTWEDIEDVIGRDGVFDLYLDTHYENVGIRWGKTDSDFAEHKEYIPASAPKGAQEALKKAKAMALLLGIKR